MAPWAVLAVTVVAALVVASGSSSTDDTPEARVAHITEQLRCPTCQGLSVADSPSSTARAITDDVRQRVESGEPDDEIKQAYVDRYGEWILLRPRSSGIAAAVWALPVAGAVLAVTGLFLAFRRWRRQPRMRATSADRDLVDRIRGEDAP